VRAEAIVWRVRIVRGGKVGEPYGHLIPATGSRPFIPPL
jgi:hypothetical protein